jgi:hypothetical protein
MVLWLHVFSVFCFVVCVVSIFWVCLPYLPFHFQAKGKKGNKPTWFLYIMESAMLLNPFRNMYLCYPLFEVSWFEVFCVVSVFVRAIHLNPFAFTPFLDE